MDEYGEWEQYLMKFGKKVLAFCCSISIAMTDILGCGLFVNSVFAEETTAVPEATTQSEKVTVQTGKVNGDLVNVRTGAGTSYEYLRKASGDKIQLNRNHEIEIINTVQATDGANWYQVKFYFEGANYTGYIFGELVNIVKHVDYVEDMDFEKYLSDQGFPESYKDGLRDLHAQYPKWKFVADHLDYDFNTVLENESIIGRSLVENTSISSWKSTEQSAYNYTTGTWYGFDGAAWVAASKDIVAYCLDPRNFLDSSSIFQFEKLAYDENLHTIEGVQSVVKNTFMEENMISNDLDGMITYAQAILFAAQTTGVSPYHLASRIIQEMGVNGGSGSISGAVSGYEGLYNYFNQGAYAHDGRSAIINGLRYARSNGWNSRLKAIIGGSEYIGKTYINLGQNTLYYEKFDFVGTPYTHQYMTNILAPYSESANVAKGYSEEMRKELALVFVIPVYKDLPDTVCPKPTGNGSPNNILTNLSVEGYSLTPTFNEYVYSYDLIVGENANEINISAIPLDGKAQIEGAGKVAIAPGDNSVTINVKAANGDIRSYTIYIYRTQVTGVPTIPVEYPTDATSSSESTGTTSATNSSTQTNATTASTSESATTATSATESTKPVKYELDIKYKVDETNKYIYGIEPDTSSLEVLKNITAENGTVYVLLADGNVNVGNVATGNQLLYIDDNGKEVARYTFIIYGDVDGDASVTSLDLLFIKRHIVEANKLTGAYLEAADTDRCKDGVTSIDLLYAKRHVLSISKIKQ